MRRRTGMRQHACLCSAACTGGQLCGCGIVGPARLSAWRMGHDDFRDQLFANGIDHDLAGR